MTLRRLGQQSLAIFMTGLFLALLAGAALFVTGRGFASVALVNMTGIGLLIAVAKAVSYFKSSPWSRPAVTKPKPEPAIVTSSEVGSRLSSASS